MCRCAEGREVVGGAAVKGLGALFFRYADGAGKRLTHCGIAASLGADHRGADTVQFGIPPRKAGVRGHRQGAIEHSSRFRDPAEPQQRFCQETHR